MSLPIEMRPRVPIRGPLTFHLFPRPRRFYFLYYSISLLALFQRRFPKPRGRPLDSPAVFNVTYAEREERARRSRSRPFDQRAHVSRFAAFAPLSRLQRADRRAANRGEEESPARERGLGRENDERSQCAEKGLTESPRVDPDLYFSVRRSLRGRVHVRTSNNEPALGVENGPGIETGEKPGRRETVRVRRRTRTRSEEWPREEERPLAETAL